MTELPAAAVEQTIRSVFETHVDVVLMTLASQKLALQQAADRVLDTLRQGKKILLCGNGGSAADCQHMAAEIVGRFELDRPGLPAIALTTDSSNLTALSNDMGYEQVFARQVQALATAGDLLWVYSTSGKSANILRAAQVAQQMGCCVFALTGGAPNPLTEIADVAVAVPSNSTARIQEVHLMVGHVLCSLVDQQWSA